MLSVRCDFYLEADVTLKEEGLSRAAEEGEFTGQRSALLLCLVLRVHGAHRCRFVLTKQWPQRW